MTRQLLAVFSFFICTLGAAHAQDFSAYRSASQSFFEVADRPSGQRVLPRLSDPNSASMIATLSDSHALLDRFTFKGADLDELVGICVTAEKVARSYAMQNLKKDLPQSGLSAPEQTLLHRLVLGNVNWFEPELALLHPFLIKCLAKAIDPLAEVFDRLDASGAGGARLDWYKAVRNEISRVYAMLMVFAMSEHLGGAYREALLKSLAEVSDSYRKAMPVAERSEILEIIGEAAPASREASSLYLEIIKTAMSNRTCDRLCAIP
jgi:hypothetical protein